MQLVMSKWLMGWARNAARHHRWRTRLSAGAPHKRCFAANGSELVTLLQREQLRAFQAEPPQPETPLEIAYIGAFDPWHGLTVLIEAAARAKAKGARLHLTVIGGGKEQAAIERTIVETNMQARYPTGISKRHLPPARQGRGGCVALLWTGCVYLALDARLQSGRFGDLDIGRKWSARYHSPGETGWVVPPCDVKALAEAIVTLYHAPERRRAMGQAARLEAEKLHSWQHVAEELELLFNRLISR
jgi:glycosyltransferase involved in cell wall biosynthesis